uniref:Photosystem I assembly factor PSA3, chloroplastic n=1 Tax=Daucus carota subsp. sativus TaxID=79200 RepID=A0A164VW80_DAUCS
MVVVTSINTTCTLSPYNNTTLHSPSATPNSNFYTFICRPTSPSLFYLQQLCKNRNPTKPKSCSYSNGILVVKGYREDSTTVSGFVNKVVGALPLVGLVARIFSDVGGVGGDIVDFAEFRRRVGNNSSVNDSRAFVDFQDRRGKAGDPIYVLACCWLAAVGAGLLKSEEILEGVSRLRLSNDIEFEEETFLALMKEAKEVFCTFDCNNSIWSIVYNPKVRVMSLNNSWSGTMTKKRSKSKTPAPSIPIEARAEKAMEAIYICCFGRDPIEEVDEQLLCIMLAVVFPTVGKSEINRIVSDQAKRVAEGIEEKYPEPKPLSKEAVQLQMKDLQFLRQNSET